MKLTKEMAAAELARRSLTDFVRVVRPDLSTTAFHRRYYRTLDAFAGGKIRRLIVSIPPQHGKSSGSSVLLPAYLLGIRPETKIALASYNLQLASRFNRQIQQTIDSAAYAASPDPAHGTGTRSGPTKPSNSSDRRADCSA